MASNGRTGSIPVPSTSKGLSNKRVETASFWFEVIITNAIMGCVIVIIGLIFCWIYGWAEGLFFYALLLGVCLFVLWIESKIADQRAAEKATPVHPATDTEEADEDEELESLLEDDEEGVEFELLLTDDEVEIFETEQEAVRGHIAIPRNQYLDPPYPVQQKQAYYVGKKLIGLSPRKGYSRGWLVGMSYRGLQLTDIGKFEGYAEAQQDNPHDPHAIAIYREDHTHVGYLMRGQHDVWEHIQQQGGYVHVYGYIACKGILAQDEKPVGWYAEVCVEVDPLQVVDRNAPYKTTDKFYTYTSGWLQNFLSEKQQLVEQ